MLRRLLMLCAHQPTSLAQGHLLRHSSQGWWQHSLTTNARSEWLSSVPECQSHNCAFPHTAVLTGSPAHLSISAHSGPAGKCAALTKAHGVRGSSRNSSEMVQRRMDLLNFDVLICVHFVMWMNGWTDEDSDRWEKMKKHPVCLNNACRAVVPLRRQHVPVSSCV